MTDRAFQQLQIDESERSADAQCRERFDTTDPLPSAPVSERQRELDAHIAELERQIREAQQQDPERWDGLS